MNDEKLEFIQELEEDFEEINGSEIFDQMVLGNKEKLKKKLMEYDGDTEKLSELMEAYETFQHEQEQHIPEASRVEPEFNNKIPSTHFIAKYIETCEELTDAYPEYHFGTALSMLSLGTQRKALANITPTPKYVNIWVLLLGKSTVSRKSTAIGHLGKQVLEYADMEDLLHPEEFSKEQLFTILSNDSKRAYWNDEFGDFLAAMRKQYQLGMSGFLCRMYDSPSHHKKELRNDEFEISDAFLPILTATQPETFAKHSQEEDIDSGLYPRFLYVYPTRFKERKPIEEPDEDAVENLMRLGSWLKDVNQYFESRSGDVKFGFSEEAFELHEEWASRVEQHIQENDSASGLAAFFGRMQIYAFKLAVLFAVGSKQFRKFYIEDDEIEDQDSHNSHDSHTSHVSHNSQDGDINSVKGVNPVNFVNCANRAPTDNPQVTKESMKFALYYIDKLFLPTSLRIQRLIEGFTDENQIEQVFEKLMEQGGKTTRSKLLRYTHMEADRFETCINTLVQADRLKKEVETKEKNGREYETIYFTALQPDKDLEIDPVEVPDYENPIEDDFWEENDLEKIEEAQKEQEINEMSNKNKERYVKGLVNQMQGVNGGEGVSVQELVENSKLSEQFTEKVIENLKNEGSLYEPKNGKVKVL